MLTLNKTFPWRRSYSKAENRLGLYRAQCWLKYSCAFLALLFSAGNIHADSIAYEPFAYSQGSLLSDSADGGSGWVGSWQRLNNVNLLRAENASAVNQGRNAAGTRDLANPFSVASGTYYFSFIAKADAAGRFDFNLRDTSGSTALIRWAFSRNDDGSFAIRAGNSTATSPPGLFLPDREYLVISKFVGNASTASVKIYEVATLDDTPTEPTEWDLVSTGLTSVTLNNVELRMPSGNAAIGELRLGTDFAEMIPIRRNTIVFAIDHPATSETMSWTHRVEEAGNYQVGLAWIEMLSGGSVALELFKNDMRVKAMNAPLGEVTRFETRLENLAVDDEITVRATPDSANYRIGYQIAFGTPTFDGLPVYHVDDFGAVGDGTTDDRIAIREAVNAAIAGGGGIVHFDGTKTYRVIGDTSPEIENLFDLENVRNIKIVGNGAKLLLYPPDRLAFIDYSENIQLDGFTVNYDPLPYYQGTIDAIDVANRTVDITVPERYEVPLVGPNHFAPRKALFGHYFVPDAPGARTGSGQNLYIDETVRNGGDRQIRIHISDEAEGGAPMTPRLQAAYDQNATEMIVPHRDYGHRGAFSLSVRHSSRVTISNVLFHLIPHMGIQPAENVGPITFSNVDLLMKDPSTELFFSWRGAYSVTGHNRWGFLIEDGDWHGSAMYDDILAFYTRTQAITAIDGETLTLQLSLEVRARLFRPGDWLSIWSEDQDVLRGMSRIVAVGEENANRTVDVTLESLPSGTSVNDLAINEDTYNRDTLVRNCTTSNVGSRHASTRIRTGGHFLNCHFDNMFVLTEFDPAFKPVRARNLVLENCYIRAPRGIRSSITLLGSINPRIINCTLDGTEILGDFGAELIYLNGNSWVNMTGDIVDLQQGSEAWVFGDSSRNGRLTGLSDWVLLSDGSTISFTEPIGYTPMIPPSDGTDVEPPAAPEGLTSHIFNSSLWLYWERSPEPDFYSYTVYRSNTASGPFTLVASDLRINKWVDQDVSIGDNYYYIVTSSDNSGNESLSSIPHEVTVSAPVQLVFEDFNYPDGTSLSADVARGGIGFLGGWQAIGTDILAVFDGKMTQTGSATRGILNTFELNSPDTYMSFLATSDVNGEFTIHLKQTDGNFVRWAFARNADGSVSARAGINTNTSAPGIFAADTEYLVVSRFDTSTDTTYFKLFDTSNPGSFRTEPTQWDISASGLTGVTIDRIDVHLSSGTVTLDNLRIGRTYESVAVLDVGYDQWAAFYGLTGGPQDDDDGDGLSNLLEYALGGNPTDPADRGFPLVTQLVEAADKKWFEITYPRRADFSGNLDYVVQVSQTLLPGSWSSSGLEQVEIIPQGYGLDFDSVTVRFEVTDKDRLFIRLLVERL